MDRWMDGQTGWMEEGGRAEGREGEKEGRREKEEGRATLHNQA